jgi:glyceraldehyde 3-phosphate dehydrogenase
MIKVGINGFGRIGRYFARMVSLQEGVEVDAVNDVAPVATLSHLYKYDSIHRIHPVDFKIEGNKLNYDNGQSIQFSAIRNPEEIPWGDMGVDIVVECTGIFRTEELASKHFIGGAKKVVISAPAKSEGVRTVVIGINDDLLEETDRIVSNASCTTNCAAPLVKVMKTLCNIQSAYITTVHSYTSDQKLHVAPHSDLRRARAAAENIVPTTTGAAKAISKIFPELEGHIGGCGIRVPVPDGSLTDMTFVVDKPISIEEINAAYKMASENELKGILSYTEDPIVSVDILGNPHSTIFDAQLTSVIGNMVKIVGWYDNEAGYSNRLVDLVRKIG